MINKLILGTVQLGIPYGINNLIGKPDSQQANLILKLAKESGITTLDTAKAYGNAMQVIGDYHRSSAFNFKVISKFHSGNPNFEEDINTELAILGIKQFEAYLFHSFTDFENVKPETIKKLTILKQQAIIKKIGVSVYGNEQFEKAIQNDSIDVIQLPFNLLDNTYQRGELMKQAKNNGKELHVRSVFLQGLFFMNEKEIPEKLKPLSLHLKTIHEMAHSHGLTLHELALNYVIQNVLIDKVLIGVDSVDQLILNISAVEKANTISKEVINKIDNLKIKEINLLNPVNWN